MSSWQGADQAPDDRSEAPPSRPAVAVASLDGLGIAGIDRRRVALIAGTFLTIWIVAVFARQVGDASAAGLEADGIRAGNATLQAEIDRLGGELGQIQEVAFLAQQARVYDLGSSRERAFTLAPDAPALPADAPGSAAHRLGTPPHVATPLETWLTALFGAPPH